MTLPLGADNASTSICRTYNSYRTRSEIPISQRRGSLLKSHYTHYNHYTYYTCSLLHDGLASKLTNQVIELACLLILRQLVTVVQDANLDTRIHTPEALGCLRRHRHTLATPNSHDSLLQPSQVLVYIQVQVLTEERCIREPAMWLVGTGKGIFHQLVSDQPRIVITPSTIEGTNS